MAGFRILRDPSAFSNAPAKGQKRPAVKDGAHLKWLHELPCIVTGKRPVDAAHVSYADPAYGKRERGKSEKTDDRWAVPLCREQHDRQHHMGDERAYWRSVGIDPLKVALALYAVTGDNDQAEIIIRNARTR